MTRIVMSPDGILNQRVPTFWEIHERRKMKRYRPYYKDGKESFWVKVKKMLKGLKRKKK